MKKVYMNLPNKIELKIKASHYNFINDNFFLYSEKAVKKGSKSWISPYKRPFIINHDKNKDPLGRVYDVALVKSEDTNEPENYILLTAYITDKDAIEKVLDGRYDTVSVGSRSNKIICSECDQILTHDGLCEHKKGSLNDEGERIYWIIDQITYIEVSFVNEPADQFAGIYEINLGKGWINYKDFLANQETYLKDINMEDNIMIKTDSKLSPEQRSKLPESLFCGPNRYFPAHDQVHVEAGLKLIDTIEIDENTKGKIKASLYRKGRAFNIIPTEDQLKTNPDLVIFRTEDTFTEEEISKINDWFKNNPDSDLPKLEDETNSNNETEVKDSIVEPSKMKKEELLEAFLKLKDEFSKVTDEKDQIIKDLEDKFTKNETILNDRTDQVQKYLDDIAIIETKYRSALVGNIIDLKMADNINEEAKTEYKTSLSSRRIESLVDTLEDARLAITKTDSSKVEDPTNNANNSDHVPVTDQNIINDPFEIFSQDRTTLEVE